MIEQSGCGCLLWVVLSALKVCTDSKKKCKKVNYFCNLFCRLKKNVLYLYQEKEIKIYLDRLTY